MAEGDDHPDDRIIPHFLQLTCAVCGRGFSYAPAQRGRRRQFCSAECKREAHKLHLRRYAGEDRYGRRAAARAARDQAAGPLLPYPELDPNREADE